MKYKGSFVNRAGDTVTVQIVTGGSADEVQIGTDASGLYFAADDAVQITSSVNDTFDHLLRSSASLRLLTSNYLPDLFRAQCTEAVVHIFRNGECVFAGYVEPQVYSQPYNETLDELELSCIDALSALQYSRYRRCGAQGAPSFASLRAGAAMRSFIDILKECIDTACAGFRAVADAPAVAALYDGSKALTATSTSPLDVFTSVAVAELLFIGTGEEDVWTLDRVLEAMLRYLNLHIAQEGTTFRIFAWETVRATTGNIKWYDLLAATPSTEMPRDTALLTSSLPTVTDTSTPAPSYALVADTGAQISIAEVYNQISLTCRVENVESIIESPLDSSALTSPYPKMQKYVEELAADGNGITAINGFRELIRNGYTQCDLASRTAWYMQVMQPKNWRFPLSNTDDLMAKYCGDGHAQHELPHMLGNVRGAGIVSFGKVELDRTNPTEVVGSDGKFINKVDLTPYMVISVNGNGDKLNPRPTVAELKAACPRAVFTGGSSGSVLSPTDSGSTNYIVISGSLRLNRNTAVTDTYKNLATAPETDFQKDGKYWGKTVTSKNNNDGRYFTMKHFACDTPYSSPKVVQPNPSPMLPPLESVPSGFSTSYSSIGGQQSFTLPVLFCMLTVGNKCWVNTGGVGKWKDFKPLSKCSTPEEYYAQCFTVGINCPNNEFLVGEEFDIANNVTFNSGIDAQGTAIPIHASDKLSGPVQFSILGPVNMYWSYNNTSKKGSVASVPSFAAPAGLGAGWEPVLASVSSIMIKNFEVKIYSDNGKANNTDTNDLVYISDTQTAFTNKKDGIEFEINSALTTDEYHALGITETVKLSTPLRTDTSTPLRTIYDRNLTTEAKPEQIYVDAYYTEYSAPRVMLTQNISDTAAAPAHRFRHYRHPALGDKGFYVVGISRNLMAAEAELTLKQTWT